VTLLTKYAQALDEADPIKYTGAVDKVQGLLIESVGPQAVVGELCRINLGNGDVVPAEVVGLHENRTQLMAFGETTGIEVGCDVTATGKPLSVRVSDSLLGRVLDARGRPIDGGPELPAEAVYPALADPPDVMSRRRITTQLETGVRSIDALIPVGRGQRMGIFSGSGVGKSTLLGMIARNTQADVNVIALIGERGREVREFLENDLGPEGRKRSVVVVSTSNSPPLARLRAANVATAIAEYFRDEGADVMLLFDSVTRFARAQRELGLAVGEPPATRGFTPSVFSTLPKLLERCGTSDRGTITGFYTILVEGDDMDEPVADTVRAILDGHVVLARRLAQRYHYPAVDVLASISRLATQIAYPEIREAAGTVRRLLSVYSENEDIISVGAYARGSSPEIDEAIDAHDTIRDFLQQGMYEKSSLRETLLGLCRIAGVTPPAHLTEEPAESGSQESEHPEESAVEEPPVEEHHAEENSHKQELPQEEEASGGATDLEGSGERPHSYGLRG